MAARLDIIQITGMTRKAQAHPMSDIGILNSPLELAFVLLLGAPGLPVGAIAGTLLWRRHRAWGAGLGTLAGFGLWPLSWLYFTDNP